jgi:integral membrane sensor domain MASE1
MLLVAACALGILLTIYAAWATQSVPAGLGRLTGSLTDGDRDLLADSWFLHTDQPIPVLRHAPQLILLGLTYLVFPPLAYFMWLGFRLARTVTYLFGVVLAGLAGLAIIGDDELSDPGLDRLSADARQAWLALLPPGYHGVHDVTLAGMIVCVFLAYLLLDRPVTHRFLARRHTQLLFQRK